MMSMSSMALKYRGFHEEDKQNKALQKDHYWWIHPKLRGGQVLEKNFADSMKYGQVQTKSTN